MLIKEDGVIVTRDELAEFVSFLSLMTHIVSVYLGFRNAHLIRSGELRLPVFQELVVRSRVPWYPAGVFQVPLTVCIIF